MEEVSITMREDAAKRFDELKEMLLEKMSPKKVEVRYDPRYGTITLDVSYVDPPAEYWY